MVFLADDLTLSAHVWLFSFQRSYIAQAEAGAHEGGNYTRSGMTVNS